jgi:hypothetical protein
LQGGGGNKKKLEKEKEKEKRNSTLRRYSSVVWSDARRIPSGSKVGSKGGSKEAVSDAGYLLNALVYGLLR